MSRVSIVLRGDDAEDFEKLKKKFDFERNIDVVRKLMSFYRVNSPYLKQTEGGG